MVDFFFNLGVVGVGGKSYRKQTIVFHMSIRDDEGYGICNGISI